MYKSIYDIADLNRVRERERDERRRKEKGDYSPGTIRDREIESDRSHSINLAIGTNDSHCNDESAAECVSGDWLPQHDLT